MYLQRETIHKKVRVSRQSIVRLHASRAIRVVVRQRDARRRRKTKIQVDPKSKTHSSAASTPYDVDRTHASALNAK